MGYIILAIIIFALFLIVTNIAIVPQATSYVVERMGIYLSLIHI